jgi:hypothetical protein
MRLLVEEDYLSEGFRLFESYADMLYTYFTDFLKLK